MIPEGGKARAGREQGGLGGRGREGKGEGKEESGEETWKREEKFFFLTSIQVLL